MDRYVGRFGRDDTIVGLVEGERATADADRVAAELGADRNVRAVRDRVGPSALEYFRKHALMLLDDGGWAELVRRAGDPKTARRLRAALNSPAGSLAAERLQSDPLGAAEILGRRFAGAAHIDTESGRFATADGRAALLL